jgi:hypothetical protein
MNTYKYGSTFKTRTSSIAKIFGAIFGFITLALGTVAVIVGLAILMAFPTMWLWNYVIPHISRGNVPCISLWQALALNALCGILFKSNCKKSES